MPKLPVELRGELEELDQASGPLYVARRDALLRDSGDMLDGLAVLQSDGDWRIQLLARILLGWAAHRTKYDRFLGNMAGADDWVEAAVGQGEPMLPLAWEAIGKRPRELADHEAIAFVRMLDALPHRASVEPLVELVETTASKSVRRSAGAALAALPRKWIETVVAERLEHHRDVATTLAGIVDDSARNRG
jgi:hypothetical protein